MDTQSIILYTNVLVNTYKTNNPFILAEKLSYKVCFIDTDTFIKANTCKTQNGNKIILINSRFNDITKKVLCAHELGHAVLHHKRKCGYKDNDLVIEYEANLFAVSLLFDQKDFNMPFNKMSNYILQSILDKNIE